MRKGGAVILVARCREGFGQQAFEEWMCGMGTPQVLVDRIRREFVLGGHKAAAIAGLLTDVDVLLVSEFPDEVVRSMCMQPFAERGRGGGGGSGALRRGRALPGGAAREPRDRAPRSVGPGSVRRRGRAG